MKTFSTKRSLLAACGLLAFILVSAPSFSFGQTSASGQKSRAEKQEPPENGSKEKKSEDQATLAKQAKISMDRAREIALKRARNG